MSYHPDKQKPTDRWSDRPTDKLTTPIYSLNFICGCIIIIDNSYIAVYSVKTVKFITLQSCNIPAPTLEQCPRVMLEAGLSANFAPMVTHSIHSLTVEDMRYYFKPDATEENGIPTGNMYIIMIWRTYRPSDC